MALFQEWITAEHAKLTWTERLEYNVQALVMVQTIDGNPQLGRTNR